MEDTKVWWQSKTVWGGIIAVVAGLLGVFGYTVLPADQELIATGLASAAAAAGGIIAVIGRVTAKKATTLTKQ